MLLELMGKELKLQSTLKVTVEAGGTWIFGLTIIPIIPSYHPIPIAFTLLYLGAQESAI